MMLSAVKKAAPGCSGQPAVLDQVSGQFSSPDFGDDRLYDADLNCAWLIVTALHTVCQSLASGVEKRQTLCSFCWHTLGNFSNSP